MYFNNLAKMEGNNPEAVFRLAFSIGTNHLRFKGESRNLYQCCTPLLCISHSKAQIPVRLRGEWELTIVIVVDIVGCVHILHGVRIQDIRAVLFEEIAISCDESLGAAWRFVDSLLQL